MVLDMVTGTQYQQVRKVPMTRPKITLAMPPLKITLVRPKITLARPKITLAMTEEDLHQRKHGASSPRI